MASPSETGLLTIPANGQVTIQVGRANYIYCYKQTGLVEITLRNDRRSLETHMIERLGKLEEREFDEVIIRDRSGAENAVRFFYGPGKYGTSQDGATVSVAGAISGEVSIVGTPTVNLTGSSVSVESDVPSTFEALDDVLVEDSPVLLVASSATLLGVEISVPDDAVNGIRVGDAGVSATAGVRIAPGMVYSKSGRHDLYAIRDGATSVTVSMSKSGKSA